tara:strand:- start:299 stop:1108 length:810 start_codon:yes stop_codon:yes gene_type:complete
MSGQKKSRTLINILGIPFLISAIYFGGFYFSTLIYLAILIGILEFRRICKGKEIYIQLIPIFIALILIILNPYNIELLFIISILIGTYEIFRKKENPISNIGTTIFTIVWVCFFMNYIILIRNIPEQGMLLTFVMFLSVWICDTLAFFFGSKFGEKKILPKISPNKTWFGSIAGFIGVLVFNFILLKFNILYQENYNFTVFDVLNFSIIFGIIGQLGDFLESMIKRELNVKDSGTILQGHGGVLDRMDSLILAAPCYYIYLKFIMGING